MSDHHEVYDVLIAGAGFAGLTVAYHLLEKQPNLRIQLVESQPRVGGNIVTLEHGSSRIDLGPDVLIAQPPAAFELCNELGLTEALIAPSDRSRRIFVAHQDALHPLPSGLVMGIPTEPLALATTRLVSWSGKIRALLDFVLPKQTTSDKSLGTLIEYRLGKEIKSNLVEPLLGGIYGAKLDDLDAQTIMPMLGERLGSLSITLHRKSSTKGPVAPEQGMSVLVQKLLQRIGDARIQTNTRVQSCHYKDSHWIVRLSNGQVWKTKHLVLAVPPPEAARMLEQENEQLAETLRTLRMKSLVSVVMAFEENTIEEPAGVGILPTRAEQTPFHGVTFVSQKWPSRCREERIVRLVMGGESALTVQVDDETVIQGALEHLQRYVRCGQPRWWHVQRFPCASVIPEVGHRDRLRKIHDTAAQHTNLHLTGAALSGTGLASTAKSARMVSEKILAQ